MNHYLQSGGLNPLVPCSATHLLVDWPDLRTLIRDIYIYIYIYSNVSLLSIYPSITYDKRTSDDNNSATDRSHHEIKSTVFYLSF